jgi:hypothetical protein
MPRVLGGVLWSVDVCRDSRYEVISRRLVFAVFQLGQLTLILLLPIVLIFGDLTRRRVMGLPGEAY